jgi:hypothetical protein
MRAINVGALAHRMIRRSQGMQTITTIGLDIVKSVFQVHGVDAGGRCGCAYARRACHDHSAAGRYRVTRQREYTPEEVRHVAD